MSGIHKFLERILSELPELGEIRVAAVGPCQLRLNRYGRIVAGKCYGEFFCCTFLIYIPIQHAFVLAKYEAIIVPFVNDINILLTS